ncbi:MAG TPA: DHHA1 domain-containing protein [Candidatus Limnocylindrales bacterium]|nr:DHHA1 domain-containing protein [Candidatus Limnocylindrales bacterium]
MTRLLYREDPTIRDFEGTVLETIERDGATWAELDRTAFYPGGGGQPPDRGSLDTAAVTDVREEEGRVWHRVERAMKPGAAVKGTLDWARRFDHMQQHTGQHILSQAFIVVASAETRSFHLGEEEVVIDVAHPGPDPDLLRRVEERANEIVWEDREVLVHEVPRDEAGRFPLRKLPAVEGLVRIVEVRGFDWSACGGTHVSRSGQVGIVTILSTEKYKGGTRVAFVCGGRALRRQRERMMLLRDLSLAFTAGEADLPKAVARLKEDRERLDRRVKTLLKAELEREASALIGSAPRGAFGPVVARHFPDRDPAEIGILAALVAALGGIALLVAGTDTPRAHFSASAGTISMGDLLGRLCREFGGKGGGRPESAQGTIPAQSVVAALSAAEAAALAGNEEGTTG